MHNTISNNDLQCIENSIIKVIYPHFANTYLLPYYVDKKEFLGKNASSVLCKWDNIDIISKIDSEEKGDIFIFYATESIDTLINDKFKSFQCDFSFYQPRLMFLPFSIELYKKHYQQLELESHQLTIDAIDNELDIVNLIPTFEDIKEYLSQFRLHDTIYSDTSEQANYLRERLVLKEYFSSKSTSPYLKLLYYSAPYSIYLLNQYPEFLPVRLDHNWLNGERDFQKYFKTYNYIYCKNSENCQLKNNCSLVNHLTKFYAERFFEAKSEPKLFYDIFNKYVEKNNEQIPFHIFKDVDCFAKAISLFHNYDSSEEIQSIKLKISIYRNLTNKQKGDSFKLFNKSLDDLKYSACAFYILLIYSYIFRQNHNTKEFFFHNIARSLIDKNFLNGKYYFIYNAVLNTIYLDFRTKIKSITNNIEAIKAEAKITEKEVYSIYRSFLFSHVIDTIKEINLETSFNYLKYAIDFGFSNPTSSHFIPFSEMDYKNSLYEIKETIKFVINEALKDDMFSDDQKKQLRQSKNKFSRKEK